MKLKRANIGNGPYANANIACIDPSSNELVFLSAIGYETTMKSIAKEVNRKNVMYIERMGNAITTYKGYEVIKTKDQESAYSHLVAYKKDEVKTNRSEREFLNAYIFIEMPEEFKLNEEAFNSEPLPESLLDGVYDKLYEHTPVPVLREWSDYITKELVRTGSLRELYVYRANGEQFKVFRIHTMFDSLFTIVSNGLQNKVINVNGKNEVSPEIQEITGLDSYLNAFTGILADKIQNSFKPKFTPGIDAYNSNLETFYDYASYKGLTLYDAQKATIQAASNNLDKNNVSFIIGEMGSGSIVHIF